MYDQPVYTSLLPTLYFSVTERNFYSCVHFCTKFTLNFLPTLYFSCYWKKLSELRAHSLHSIFYPPCTSLSTKKYPSFLFTFYTNNFNLNNFYLTLSIFVVCTFYLPRPRRKFLFKFPSRLKNDF